MPVIKQNSKKICVTLFDWLVMLDVCVSIMLSVNSKITYGNEQLIKEKRVKIANTQSVTSTSRAGRHLGHSILSQVINQSLAATLLSNVTLPLTDYCSELGNVCYAFFRSTYKVTLRTWRGCMSPQLIPVFSASLSLTGYSPTSDTWPPNTTSPKIPVLPCLRFPWVLFIRPVLEGREGAGT